MFNPFRSRLEKAYGSEKDVKKQEEAAWNKIRAADAAISKGEDEGLRGSGTEYENKMDMKEGHKDLGEALINKKRLDYYTEVKGAVGPEDAAVLGKMQEDAAVLEKMQQDAAEKGK